MAEDGGHAAYVGDVRDPALHPNSHANNYRPSDITTDNLQKEPSPMSPRAHTPNPFSRKNTSLDLDDYFVRPTPQPSRELKSQERYLIV